MYLMHTRYYEGNCVQKKENAENSVKFLLPYNCSKITHGYS